MSTHPFQNFMVRYVAGEPIFSEGDQDSSMFIIQSGKVTLFRQVNGEKHRLGCMEKGDFFGEMSILEGLPRTHSAEASEDAELIEINSTIFDKMVRSNIEIAIRMLRKLSIRLREAESRLSDVGAGGSSAAGSAGTGRGSARKPRTQVRTGVRLEAEEGGISFELADGETMLGRYDPVTELKPDIDLTELDLKRSVSRQHARVVRVNDGYVVVEEVGALNGTFVNGTQLIAGQQQPILDGDRISLGTVHMVFRR